MNAKIKATGITTTTAAEALFYFKQDLEAICNIKGDGGYSMASMRFADGYKRLEFYTEFTAKKQTPHEIIATLKMIQVTFAEAVMPKLKYAYDIKLPVINMESISDSLSNYDIGYEQGFAALCLVADIKADAEQAIIEKCSAILETKKAKQSYISSIDIRDTYYGSFEYTLNTENLSITQNSNGFMWGNAFAQAKSDMYLNFNGFAMGLSRHNLEMKPQYSDTLVQHNIKQLLQAKGTITHNGETYSFVVQQGERALGLIIYDHKMNKMNKVKPLTVSNTLSGDVLWVSKAELRKILNANFAKGVKITNLEAAYIKNKVIFANYLKYKSITLVLRSDIEESWSDSKKAIVTLDINGEWSATDLYGNEDIELSRSIEKKFKFNALKNEKDILAAVFNSNKRFALHTLNQYWGANPNAIPTGIYFNHMM